MPRKYNAKNKKPGWSDDDMRRALELIGNGQSVRSTARQTGIPLTTLHDHKSGKIEIGARRGRVPALPRDVEEEIISKTIKAAKSGFGISRFQLQHKAGRVAKALKLSTPFLKDNRGNMVAGREWYEGLKKRWPELTIRKPSAQSTSRSKLMDRKVVEKYFSQLQQLLDVHQFGPREIWNMDESNISFEHSPTGVVCVKGMKKVPGRVSNNRRSSSILGAVNAAGDAMPWTVIVQGKTRGVLSSWNTHEAPEGTYFTYQHKAWMTDVLGEDWFVNVFLKNCGEARPQLLILDSHSSHEVLELLEIAVEEDIHILALPPHTTHWLQPLDKSVFGPLSRAYNKACSQFMVANPNHQVTTRTWPKLFKEAVQNAVTPDNIRSGFRATGIYPLNPEIIPLHAYQPADPFKHPSTPLPSTSSSPVISPIPAFSYSEGAFIMEVPEGMNDIEQLKKQLEDIGLSVTIPKVNEAVEPNQALTTLDMEIHQEPEQNLVEGGNALGRPVGAEPDVPESFPSLAKCTDVERAVESEFCLPATQQSTPSRPRRPRINSSRILTSPEIIQEKQRKDEERRQKEEAKERRRKERELKRKLKLENEEIKQQKKKKVELSKEYEEQSDEDDGEEDDDDDEEYDEPCDICEENEDARGNGKEADRMVECNICLTWYHVSCARYAGSNIPRWGRIKFDKFVCYKCA